VETPVMAIGLLQEAKARAATTATGNRTIARSQEQSERNQRLEAMWSPLAKVVQFFRRPATSLKDAPA
jgi:hypothetical protein